jgi:hypothetical protein
MRIETVLDGQSDEPCGDLNGLFGFLGFFGGSPCGSPSLLRLMIMVLAMGSIGC